MLGAAVACGSLMSATSAQIAAPAFDFVVDTPASAFTWTGTTSLGPLQGNPSNSFNLQGNQALIVTSAAGQPLDMGQFVDGGAASVVGTLQASVPNPVPFLPDLATITISNLSFVVRTSPFPLGAGGSFSTLGDVEILSGIVDVVPLIGMPSQTDLAGTISTGQTVTGALAQSGSVLTATSLQNSSFTFNDPASGTSATINLMGMIVANSICATPVTYCTSNPNSTGFEARTTITGSTRLQDQSAQLETDRLPLNSAGFYVFSDTPGNVPNPAGSQGVLCLGGTVLRLSNFIQNSGATGAVDLGLPFGGLPAATVLQPGEEWHFQYWYRDAIGGTPTSNFSDAVRVVFCP